MINHPEQKKDEIFMGNTSAVDGPRECFRHLKSLRIGDRAYDVEGKEKLPKDYMRPLFIGKHEAPEYDRIYLEQMK